jgi:peptide-methionine (S)-S-oxide reductase
MFPARKMQMVDPAHALPGRSDYAYPVPAAHAVTGRPIRPPFPDGVAVGYFAMGCFWGAERLFWQIPGVYSTAVGYAGGYTPHPTYEETCSNRTGHAETVLVVHDPAQVSYPELLRSFFEEHDPTQGMRQGNDIGTAYRSAIFTATPEQARQAAAALDAYSQVLHQAGFGPVTTQIAPVGPFYYAEGYHQQYLHKVPGGYCGLAGTGLSCPVGLFANAAG